MFIFTLQITPYQARRFINEASQLEPVEKMKVDIQNIIFEGDWSIVESKEHESLTLIANERLMQQTRDCPERNLLETRKLCQFEIKLTKSDSTSELIFTFWNVQIRNFVHFARSGSRIKLVLMSAFLEGVFTVNFLNPGDAQLFWGYASRHFLMRKVSLANNFHLIYKTNAGETTPIWIEIILFLFGSIYYRAM